MSELYFSSGVDDQFIKDVNAMMAKVTQLQTVTNKKTGEMGDAFDKLSKRAVQAFSVYSTYNFINQVIKVRTEIEQLEIAFKSFTGSSVKSKQLMNDLVNMASATPFTITQLGDATKRMVAYGESVDTVLSTVRMLGDVSAGTGSDLDRITLAYGQIRAKGVLRGQEINQLAEAGIPIVAQLSELLGKSRSEILKVSEAGAIGFKDVEQVFFNMTAEGGKFHDMLILNSKTMGGMVSNLKDKYTIMLNEIGEGNSQIIKGSISMLTTLVDNWESVAKVLGTVVAGYGAYRAAVMATAAINAVEGVMRAIPVLNGLTTALFGATAAQTGLNTAMSLNPIGAVVALISALVAGLVLFVDWSTDTEKKLEDLKNGIKDSVDTSVKSLQKYKDELYKSKITEEEVNAVRDKLIEQYPALMGHLKGHTYTAKQLTDEVDKLSSALTSQLTLMANTKQIKEWTKLNEDAAKRAKAWRDSNQGGIAISSAEALEKGIKDRQFEIDKLKLQNNEINKAQQLADQAKSIQIEEDAKKVIENKKKRDDLEHQRAINAINERYIGIKGTELAHRTELNNLDLNYYSKKLKDLKDSGDAETQAMIDAERVKLAATIIEKKKERDAIINENKFNQLEISKQKKQNEIDSTGYKTDDERVKANLALEKWYLEEKLKLTSDELSREQIKGQIIGNENKSKQKDDLEELLKTYATYQTNIAKITEKYNGTNGIVTKLLKAGKVAEAKVAKEAGQDELERLEDDFLSKSDAYKSFIDKELPKIIGDGTEKVRPQIEAEMKKIQDALLIETDPEKIALLSGELEALKKALNDIADSSEKLSKSDEFEKQLYFIQSIQNSLSDIFSTLGDESIYSRAINNLANLTGSIIEVGNSLEKLNKDSSKLEKLSAFGQVAGVVTKAISGIEDEISRYEKSVDSALATELEMNTAIVDQLIAKNAAYAEGTSFFSNDQYGKMLKNLESYNMALKNQDKIIADIDRKDQIARKNELQQTGSATKDFLKNGINPDNFGQAKDTYRAFSTGGLSAISRSSNRKNDDAIARFVNQQNTDMAKSLASIEVTTKDRNKLGSFVGLDDKTKSLLQIYPELIDAQGQLNDAILEQVIADGKLSEADTARMQALLDNSKAMKSYWEEFGNYIAGIFGGVDDSIMTAFQTAYESGDDAMKSLEMSFSDMIEKFTSDAINMAIVQPITQKLNEVNKVIGEKYAKGEIDSNQLQQQVVESLGKFYTEIGGVASTIDAAYKSADELAAANGFGSAFNGSGASIASANSGIAQVSGSITEYTANEMLSRMNGLYLNSEHILTKQNDLADYAFRANVLLNKIAINSDYLVSIDSNIKKMNDKL